MITCHKSHLSARCRERGYTLDEVMPCVVSQDGDQWTVDVDHPAYPRAAKEKPTQADSPEPTAAAPNGGPGTELKGLLKTWLGITAAPNCSCNAHARQMDEWGPDVCEQRIDEIVGWLEQQARARKLPFVRFAAEQAVKLAIRRARKSATKGQC
jgi:hypothetical protein